MGCFRSQPVFIFWKFIRSFFSLVHGHNTLRAGNGKKNKQTAKAVAGAHCIYVVWRVGFLHGSSICGGVRTDASRETKEEEVRAECGGFRGLPAVLAAFTCCLKSNNSLFAARPRGPCSRLPFFPYLWQSLLQRKGVRETWVYVGSASGFQYLQAGVSPFECVCLLLPAADPLEMKTSASAEWSSSDKGIDAHTHTHTP